MKRSMLLGGWYALAIAGFLVAGDFRVTVSQAVLYKEADPWAKEAGKLQFGDTVTTTGDGVDDFLPVKSGNLSGWIAKADLVDPEDFKVGSAGSAEGAAEEGAFVKGFDPEVEKKARADNAALDKAYQNDVLPLVWDTRGVKELEIAEEALEELVIQARGSSPEADALRKEIESLQPKSERARSDWQDVLRAFRQAGRIGEFARSK